MFKRIGIIGAMEAEVALLKNVSKISKSTRICDMEFVEANLAGQEVVIAQCGMGKVNAALCAHTMIHLFRCEALINSGVAGSLDDGLNICDFVVSTKAIQHDYDASPIGFKKAEIPYTGLVGFDADPRLVKAALEAVDHVVGKSHGVAGVVCSGDQFIVDIGKKESIHRDFGGLCCEMEGAAVAQACYLSHVPFVIIRCISDKPDGSVIMNFEEFSKQAAVKGSEVVRYLIEHLSH